jgi:hypothetical protein
MNCKTHCSNSTTHCLKILLLALAGIAALGWVLLLLWNWLLPNLFTGVQAIDYWQALGILVLSKILFGSCPGRGCWRRHSHGEHLTPEERERLKAQFKSRWSHWCCTDKANTHTETTHSTDVQHENSQHGN